MICETFGKELADVLIRAKLAVPSSIHGFSDEEITALEQSIGYRLPDCYRSFLKVMGRGAGRAMPSEDIFFKDIDHVINFQSWFWKIVNKWKPTIPNRDATFAFLSHQGYIYYFFDATQGDSGVVQGYMEMDEAVKTFEPLSDFLRRAIRMAAARQW